MDTPQQVTSPVKTLHSDLLIRRMRFSDLSDVMAIESVSFGKFYWSVDAFTSELRNQIGRYYSLIDRRDNRVIGYTGYWLILDEGHITTLAVHPDFRGHALGELLLVKIMDRMSSQSIKWTTLEVRISNLSAQQLYFKYGFKTMGVRPRYYQDTEEDALIMTCESIQGREFRLLFGENKIKLIERLGGKLPEGAD